jgi:predicted N-acetyltransferase YhbS
MNATADLVWRRPTRRELAPVWPMMVAAYRAADPAHPGDETYFAAGTACDPRHRDGLWIVGERDGECVTGLRVVDRELVGPRGARIRLGGIANVGTLPSQGGRGYGSELLRRAVALMEEEGFELSLLYTGRHAFYQRAGWRRLRLAKHFRDLAAPLETPSGGGFELSEFGDAADADGAVTDENDELLRQAAAVYDTAYGSFPGALVRDTAYWRHWLGDYVLRRERFRMAAAWRGGELAAYLAVRSEEGGPSASRGDRPPLREPGELAVAEGAARPGEERALAELARFLGAGAACVSTPDVPWLTAAFASLPGTSREGDRDGGMVRALGGAPERADWTYLLSALDGF